MVLVVAVVPLAMALAVPFFPPLLLLRERRWAWEKWAKPLSELPESAVLGGGTGVSVLVAACVDGMLIVQWGEGEPEWWEGETGERGIVR